MRGPLACMLAFVSVAYGASINIDRIFFHQGKISDNLGCYFSATPIINNLHSHEQPPGSAWKTIKFMLPKTKIAAREMAAVLQEIKKNRSERYQISVQEITRPQGPIDGVLLTVVYDSRLVSVRLSSFDAIQQQPALVIQLYHRDMLHKLTSEAKPIHQVAHNKPVRIVIDKGHGGEDDGKVGHFNIKEKIVTDQIGVKVARLLSKRGYSVHTTRNGDQTVALDARTTFANTIADADLFVSLHANSAPNDVASGIETYCLRAPVALPLDQVRETDPYIGNFDRWKQNQSCQLAKHIHEHTLCAARTMHQAVPDRKVKTAVSQVLLGTDTPPALIELGFLSNQDEAKRLVDTDYQDALAQGICNGIEAFIKSRA